jgi:hypothetical protein
MTRFRPVLRLALATIAVALMSIAVDVRAEAAPRPDVARVLEKEPAPMSKELNVDLEFVKKVALEAGSMQPHDIDAVEAIYPGTFEKAVAATAARFAGRAVPLGKSDEVRRHVAALVIETLWRKRKLNDPGVESVVLSARADAVAWLQTSKSVAEARAARSPSAAPPAPAGDVGPPTLPDEGSKAAS